MTLRQRFRHMFAAARRGVPLPFNQPGTGTFLINLGLNNLDTSPIKTKDDQLDNYVGWVYACVKKISEDLRANPRTMWQKMGKTRDQWQEIPFDKLPPIFRHPNNKPNQDTWGKFIELRDIHKDTTGEAWWHLLTTSPGGHATGVELIQPDQIDEPQFNQDFTQITGWWVNPGSGTGSGGGGVGGRRLIDARDLILDFYSNPRDPLRGASPIEAFALAHHMDIYVRAYGVKLVRDGAAVGQYLKTDLDLDEKEAGAMESRLNRKFKTPGRFAVLSKGAELKHLPLPLKDLDMLRILKPGRDQIFGIYSMPASKLGLTEGSGDTNQKVADKSYQENALLPRLSTFDEIVNETLMPRVFDDPSSLFYESENPVEVDREWEFEKAERELAAGTIKVNQFLEAVGRDSIGDDGEVFFIPSNVRVVKSLSEVSETESPTKTPKPKPQPEPEPPAESEDEPIEEITHRHEESITRIVNAAKTMVRIEPSKPDSEIRRLRRAFSMESFLRGQEREERSLKSDVRSVFSTELRAIKKRLPEKTSDLKELADDWKRVCETALAITDVNGDDPYMEALEPWRRDWLDNAMRETVDDWNRAMSSAIKKSTRTGWGLFKQEVAGALDFKTFEQKAAEFAKRVAAQKVSGIQTLSIKKVRDIIRAGVEDGLSINEISKRLDRLYDQFKGIRAETIARTETAMSVNYGKFSAADESRRRLGMDIRRSWIATEDERTRDTHWNADGDRNTRNEDVDMETPYVVGGITLWHPGDADGPPGEVINCRCVETYEDIGMRRP